MNLRERNGKNALPLTSGFTQAGGIPADSFVRIWKFIARPNLCGTPACVKPPPRCTQAGDSAAVND